MHRMRIYLAGPDVFLPDAAEQAARKKLICARHGLEGVSPLDPTPEPPEWAGLAEWRRIALRNEGHISSADALIADLTPFRGPSADAGTIYEVGFGRALGRPVFAYSTSAAPFTARVLGFLGTEARADGTLWRDGEAMLIEDFGCHDNLMIDAGVAASGGTLFIEDRPDRRRDLALFERAVIAAARHLARDRRRLEQPKA